MSRFMMRMAERIKHMSSLSFVVVGTVISVTLSIVLVYLFAALFSQVYTLFLLMLSIVLPLLLTPVLLFSLMRLLQHVEYFKHTLSELIEENRKKDLMLYEQARFAFMGEMLSNIAHQWRQPLNTINLAIFASKTEFMKPEYDHERVLSLFDEIEANTQYLSGTIDDFKTFFQNKDSMRICPLKEIFDEVQSVTASILKYYGIAYTLHYDDCEDIELYAALSQVLLNLISNSLESLKSSKHYPKTIHLSCKRVDEQLLFTCCDNGIGIKQEHQNRIFDPYFSTKSKSKGTGIGLYMSRQIVEKMFEGVLTLERSPLEQTCFSISIPLPSIKSDSDSKY